MRLDLREQDGDREKRGSGSFFGILETSGGFWAVVEGRRGFEGAFPPPLNEGKTGAEVPEQYVARMGVDFGRKRDVPDSFRSQFMRGYSRGRVQSGV